MERRFDMSDFEQSLKDHADQFKLMPSKRVWNGIYNNIHPGSKWPSITVGIIFLITLVTVGNLNNHSGKTVNKEKTALLSSAKSASDANGENVRSNSIAAIHDAEEISQNSSPEARSIEKHNNSKSINTINFYSGNEKKEIRKNVELSGNNSSVNNSLNHSVKKEIATASKNHSPEKTVSMSSNDALSTQETGLISTDYFQNLATIVSPDQQINFINETNESALANPVAFVPDFPVSENSSGKKLSGNTDDLNLSKEIKSFNLKKALRKKNKNTEWIFYVTPNITTVSFNHKTIHPSVTPNPASIVLLPNQAASLELIPNSRFGFETGTEVTTTVAKNLKVVSGINLNYSSYNTISNIVHPTLASLTLTSKYGTYSKDYITYYGNGQNQNHVTLANYNVQLSIPVGFEYTIWGNKKAAIDVQSVIEPSVVLASNAYLLSSDGRYYVNDPSLMRVINLGGNFGSFVSFSSSKIRWHVGPNIRYQFLSSYKNNYSTKEHFIDYGIRIGISKVK